MANKKIRCPHKLVKHLGNYLKCAEPQTSVTDCAVKIFDDFIQAYERNDREHWGDRISRWESDLEEVFAGSTNKVMCGARIPTVAASIFSEILDNELTMAIDRVLCTLCSAVGDDLIAVSAGKGAVAFKTTELGSDVLGRKVDVVVRRQT